VAEAGYRSLAAHWIGGASDEKPPAGYRSLLGFWLGGIGSPPGIAPTAGYQSMLAYWAGGAHDGPALAVVPVGPTGIGRETGLEDPRKRGMIDDTDITEILTILRPFLN
jgi:hypothetical protein